MPFKVKILEKAFKRPLKSLLKAFLKAL